MKLTTLHFLCCIFIYRYIICILFCLFSTSIFVMSVNLTVGTKVLCFLCLNQFDPQKIPRVATGIYVAEVKKIMLMPPTAIIYLSSSFKLASCFIFFIAIFSGQLFYLNVFINLFSFVYVMSERRRQLKRVCI